MTYLLTFGLLVGMFLHLNANPVTPVNETKKVIIDTQKSTVRWDGYKVTGKHHGSVDIISGELLFLGEKLTGGHFVMDMPSIEVHDLKGESRTRLENHLKSDDFFGVQTYPKASFEIVKATLVGTDGTYKIEGRLTIKKHTHPIEFEAKLNSKRNLILADAKMKMDRSKYDVRYGSGSFFDNLGDKTIYDEFDITVNLEGKEGLKN